MNPIKQQITIAEACDWFGIENHNGLSAFGSWKGYHPEHANSIGSPQPIPEYLNDLNAMYEAEKVLTDGQAYQYRRWLQILAVKYQAGREIYGSVGFEFFASAPQRAEAFLRTIGKWEET